MASGVTAEWPVWIGVISVDLQKQSTFYRDALGMRELESGDGWIWFDGGDGRLFELIERSAAPQYDSRRYQVGFVVGDIEGAAAALVEARAERISEIEGGPDSGGRWCYFRDPEANVFSIKEPPEGSRE